ncbi:MAG: hypothetical protein WA532_09020 [Candidatus Korobacteraceae bacterium]
MKARRQLVIISICVLLFVAAVGIVVVLRKQAAPEPARLLPEADAVIYVDLATVRNLTAFDQPLPQLAPGYEEFVRETGFSFERDLDEAAMAVHRGSPKARGAARSDTRYTEVLVGHYDPTKLPQYLHQHARSLEAYRGVDVFSFPIENRTLRIALLAIDTVAISNVDDPGVIHGIIDRFKKVALPFGGPALVREYYRKIPLGSLLWAIAHLPASSNWPNSTSSFTLPGGIDVGLPGDCDVVVSLRMLTTIHARADFYTQSEQAARQFTDQTSTFLAVFRGIQASTASGAGDADVKAVFDSIKVGQSDNRAEITATIPPSFLRKLVAQPAHDAVQGETAPNKK